MYNGDRPKGLSEAADFDVFKNELQTAAACCAVVQDMKSDSAEGADDLVAKARKEGAAGVTGVSKCAILPGCSQQFMVFEATDGNRNTYIIAFRADGELYKETVATSKATPPEAENEQFAPHVDKALWRRAAAMPLRSLPPHWLVGLRERRHRLILTGYSVGGAVAALATLKLLVTDVDSAMNKQIRCYTFGAPLHGDQSYANSINNFYASHFYHAVIAGDPIPGILTLVSKVAKNTKPDLCASAVGKICTLAGIAASVALTVLGAPVGAASAVTLVSDILALIDFEKQSRKQSAPRQLPEYKFGGTVLRMDADIRADTNITFGTSPGCDVFLQKVFCVRDVDITTPRLWDTGEHPLQRFLNIIKVVNRTASSGLDNGSTSADVSRPGVSASNAPDVVEAFGCVPALLSSRRQASNKDPWLLEPQFREGKPISVCLDRKQRNIDIEVYGENIVLGFHVLYLLKGEEKLRVPCVDNHRPNFMFTNDPQQSMLTSTRFPLRFKGKLGIANKLKFDEADGEFRVDLAFGSSEPIKTSEFEIEEFNPMINIKVAESFASEPPQELVNVLIISGVVTAQAMCHAAFNAIQKNSSAADAIVEETLQKFCVPYEFVLLDRLLALVDASQLGGVMQDLPESMQEALEIVTGPGKGNLLPVFSAENHESGNWTFSKCFERTARQMFTKEMLSNKSTARQLGKNLNDTALVGPKKVLNAFLNWKLKVKAYTHAFRYEDLKSWMEEKNIVRSTSTAAGMIGGAATLVSPPIWAFGEYCVNNRYIKDLTKGVSGLIGGVPAVIGSGAVFSIWFLSHIALTPKRVYRNQPGIIDDLRLKFSSSKDQLNDWDTKLHAACILYELNSQPPHIACQMERDLSKKLTGFAGIGGYFDSSCRDLQRTKTRYELRPTLQLANYGLAGAMMYDIRRYLTGLRTTVGLIGTSQAGKSCFAHHAFPSEEVPAQHGPRLRHRTRVMSRWYFPWKVNRQVGVIDFPGSTEESEPDLYINALSLASVLVVIVRISESNSIQTVALILEVCKARRKDPSLSALICLNHADTRYEEHRGEAESCPGTTVAQLFNESLDEYKDELVKSLENRGSMSGEELSFVRSSMLACCFKPSLQVEISQMKVETDKQLALDLEAAGVKNVAGVKKWCLARLSEIP